MSDELSTEEKRVLVALYRLAKGRAGVSVRVSEVADELERERLLECTDAEFAAYHKRVLGEVAEWQRLNMS